MRLESDERRGIIGAAMCIAIVLLVCVMGYLKYHLKQGQEFLIQHADTILVYDTIVVENPIVTDSTIVRYKDVYMPVVAIDSVRDMLINQHRDSVLVTLPIQQKVYSDTAYTAWVSGYDAKLDSIRLYQQRQLITNSIAPTSKKRWGIGLQGGIGITPKGFQPYIGIGVSYNLY